MSKKFEYKYEEEILNFWNENDIFKKVNEKNKSGTLFSFVEGPPYPTGDAHLGHLRNWAIKDSVFRFRRFLGDNVYVKDGYDVHGLPVEHKVQQLLGIKDVFELKEFGEEKFVKECKIYVSKIIEDMKKIRERYGLSIGKKHYQTSNPNYLSFAWNFFKKAHNKGLLYKDYRCVAWSPGSECTLSDYEIKDTYTQLKDPSIYVKFKIREDFTSTKYDEYLLIWTTTPWTLESNMAVAVNENFNYQKVLVQVNSNKYVLVIAENLVDKVIEKLSEQVDIKVLDKLQTFLGKKLIGTKYYQAYFDEHEKQKEFHKLSLDKENINHIHSVIGADFVSLGEGEDIYDKLDKKSFKHDSKTKVEEVEIKKDKKIVKDGTGLVHIAPAHGIDDNEVGREHKIPAYCPINEKGEFFEGRFKGMNFRDANSHAVDYLKSKDIILHEESRSHKYPLCWRSKVPIVYRTCEQWYIKRSATIDNMIKENENVEWFPKTAKTAFNNLLEKAGDWAISRQRFWGIPLPIWEDEDGNFEVFESKNELENRIGKTLEDIHRDDIKNIEIENKTSKKMMKSVPYICDVWFDSGCASFASHYDEGLNLDEIIEKYYPLDFVTEGEDQIRGWFSSLFNVGNIITQKAPYKHVLFQRFVMDKKGIKMSKSLGNGITGKEALDEFGADATRFYLLSKIAPEEQLNFNVEEFSSVSSFFNTLENSLKFVNSYLTNHTIRNPQINTDGLKIEDEWILFKLHKTLKNVKHNYEKYKFNFALKELTNFLVEDFSKIYLKIIKDRCDSRDENLYLILQKILKDMLVVLSITIPFKAEKLYKNLILENKKESIFLESFPIIDEVFLNKVEKKNIEENFQISLDIIQSILNLREKSKIGLRWPLQKTNISFFNEYYTNEIKPFEDFIKQLTNIKELNSEKSKTKFEYLIKPNFVNIKKDFDNPKDIISLINTSKQEIKTAILNEQEKLELENLTINLELHILKELQVEKGENFSQFSKGTLTIDTNQDEFLIEEGYLRESIRRIQMFRKEKELEKNQTIVLNIHGSDPYLIDIINNYNDKVFPKCQIDEIMNVETENPTEYKIKDKILVLSLK